MDCLVNVRVDDRLMHGQVVAFWTNFLKVNRIIVANNEIAADEIKKSILRLSTPAGINSSIISLEKTASNLLADRYKGQRILLILKSPQDALRLKDLGVDLKKVNIGNMANTAGTVQYKASVSMNEQDKEACYRLREQGVQITAQMIPDDPEDDFFKYLEKAK